MLLLPRHFTTSVPYTVCGAKIGGKGHGRGHASSGATCPHYIVQFVQWILCIEWKLEVGIRSLIIRFMFCFYSFFVERNKQTTKVSQCPECTAEHFTTFLHASMAAERERERERERESASVSEGGG